MHVDKKRISIQGWYHGAAPPPGSDVATIAQLTSARALNAEASVFAALSPSIGVLKAEYYESLSEFISVAYLKPNVVKQLRQQFHREGSVQLLNFIRSEYADKFSESVRCSFAGLPAPSHRLARPSLAVDRLCSAHLRRGKDFTPAESSCRSPKRMRRLESVMASLCRTTLVLIRAGIW